MSIIKHRCALSKGLQQPAERTSGIMYSSTPTAAISLDFFWATLEFAVILLWINFRPVNVSRAVGHVCKDWKHMRVNKGRGMLIDLSLQLSVQACFEPFA